MKDPYRKICPVTGELIHWTDGYKRSLGKSKKFRENLEKYKKQNNIFINK